jgi:uncharacterized cupredoxin-like copper-binding protein
LLRPGLNAAAAVLLGLAPAAQAHGVAAHKAPANAPVSTEQHDWGRQGEPSSARRTMRIEMHDTMRFAPAQLRVREGDTVRLIVRNRGKTMHELVLGTPAELAAHAELMKKHPGMEHDEPYMAHVPPGQTREVVWTFNRAGQFAFACLIPGHFEAGMTGGITVTAARPSSATRKDAP